MTRCICICIWRPDLAPGAKDHSSVILSMRCDNLHTERYPGHSSTLFAVTNTNSCSMDHAGKRFSGLFLDRTDRGCSGLYCSVRSGVAEFSPAAPAFHIVNLDVTPADAMGGSHGACARILAHPYWPPTIHARACMRSMLR